MAWTRGGDANQYRGSDYNPWTHEKLWQLAGENHAAYIIPPIQHYMDGPAGFKFNPGTALSPDYKNFFFVTNAPRGHQYAFRVQNAGDSFEMVDAHEIGSGHAIVGLAFGPDGGLYGADWDGGYPLDQKGSVIRIDVPNSSNAPIRIETRELLAAGFEHRTTEELSSLINHPDMRVRMGAQFALVRQNQVRRLSELLESDHTDPLGRLHCVWGLGQLARRGAADAIVAVSRALANADHHVRAQAAKTLGEIPSANPIPILPLLSDDNLHVRVNAGLAIARLKSTSAIPQLLAQTDQLNAKQHYLRHSLVRALAESATSEQIASQSNHPNVMRRMVCVLALRHQSSPLVGRFLADESNWVATDAARAIHDDLSIDAALPQLAEALDKAEERGEAYVRRAINANFRLGTQACVARLIRFTSDRNQRIELRVDACRALAAWLDPPVLDRVEGVRRDLDVESRELDRQSIAGPLAELVTHADTPLRIAAVITARNLRIPLSRPALTTLLNTESIPVELKIQALNSIVDIDNPNTIKVLIRESRSKDAQLAVRAIEVLSERYPDSAFDTLHTLANQTTSVPVQQASIVGLARISSPKADEQLLNLGEQLIRNSCSPTVKLDIRNALQNRSGSSKNIKALLTTIDERQNVLAESLHLGDNPHASKFVFSGDGGDPDRGKHIFQTNLQAQCSRCHKVDKGGSDIGPDLRNIAKQRDRKHLLRSIVHPSGEIDKKYVTQSLLLDSGKILQGVIKSESESETVLADSKGKTITVPTDEIEEIIRQKVSLMPDMTEVLSPYDVRDLVAYLSTLK